MSKKRLDDALTAGRLIQLGFQLNYSKPETIRYLYQVNCMSNCVTFANKQQRRKKQPTNEDNDEDKLEILCLQFNTNLNLLAVGDANGRIQIYDIFSGTPVDSSGQQQHQPLIYNNLPATCLKWRPATKLLYYSHVNGFIGCWDRDSMKKSIVIKFDHDDDQDDEITCFDFNVSGNFLASVGKSYKLRVYNTNEQHELVKCFQHDSMLGQDSGSNVFHHSSRLQAVRFSDVSEHVLFTGGWDRTVKVWDLRLSDGIVDSINGPFICGSDALDVKNNLLLTASWVKEHSLCLWDIRNSKKCLQVLPVHSNNTKGEFLYGCKFFSSNRFFTNVNNELATTNSSSYSTVIACGSGTQSLHLIDYEHEQELDSFHCESPLYCLDVNMACSLIACGGMRSFYVMMGANNDNLQQEDEN